MSLTYKNNKMWAATLPVLEEHTEWFHGLVKSLFYAGEVDVGSLLGKPTSFAQWVSFAERDESIQPEMLERLSVLHSDLFSTSDSLLQSVQQSGQKPSYKSFNTFMTLYEEFLSNVRRLEKDLLLEGNGYDLFTGLRSSKLLSVDVARELDRLARHGKGFCLALARIDNFSVMKENAQKSELDAYIRLVSDLIKLSVRSFDDAYYMPDNEFALCLKQTDITGGVSALERLRKELERQGIQYNDGAGFKPLSISCCIAEPVAGDDVSQLIANLRADLKLSDAAQSDTVLKYHEMSPLQRFMQQQ